MWQLFVSHRSLKPPSPGPTRHPLHLHKKQPDGLNQAGWTTRKCIGVLSWNWKMKHESVFECLLFQVFMVSVSPNKVLWNYYRRRLVTQKTIKIVQIQKEILRKFKAPDLEVSRRSKNRSRYISNPNNALLRRNSLKTIMHLQQV